LDGFARCTILVKTTAGWIRLPIAGAGGTMTVAEWCVFGTLILYLITIASVKWISFRQFDNARPRDPAFYEDAIRARALGAHQNGIEAFPFFAVAVLLAEFRRAAAPDRRARGSVPDRADRLCLHLSRRPPDAALDSLEHRLAINIAIFFLPAIKAYLPA
jgi:hypothetical protein